MVQQKNILNRFAWNNDQAQVHFYLMTMTPRHLIIVVVIRFDLHIMKLCNFS